MRGLDTDEKVHSDSSSCQVALQVGGSFFWKNTMAVLALLERDAEVLRLEGCAEPW